MTSVIAHRGASGYEPENTMAAFERAIDMDSDGIEFDIHSTADGRFAVYHDDHVDGTRIGELTFADVVASATLPDGEAVPCLEDVLARYAAKATMYVEVKTLAPQFDAHLIQTIQDCPRPDACQVHSFDHRTVKRLIDRAPLLRGGALSSSFPVDPVAQLTDSRARVLWQRQQLTEKHLVDLVHDAGHQVIVWTADDPARIRALADMGVDGVCTNLPDVAREALT